MAIKVMLGCSGNICRSPMAEGVFRHLVREAGLGDKISADSTGTGGWHVGESPHPGTRRMLERHGIQYHHRARQLTQQDVRSADYLIAMDSSHLAHIRRMRPDGAEVGLLLDYAPEMYVEEVPDPYYDGNFEEVYELVEAGARGLLQHIRQKEGL